MKTNRTQAETHDAILTAAYAPTLGSAIDVLAEEVSYLSWTMTSANPGRVRSEAGARALSNEFRHLVEAIWMPGRVVVSSELAAYCRDYADGLRFRLLIGVFGAVGATRSDALAVRRIVHAHLGGFGCPYDIEIGEPEEMLDRIATEEIAHTALVRQRELSVEIDDQSIEVLSRWHPKIDPWIGVAALCRANPGVPMRVRATVLATQLGIDDQLILDDALERVQRLLEGGVRRGDHRSQLERAGATLTDIKASFCTPVLAAEIAVCSAEPLADPTVRTIASMFTSEADVHWDRTSVVVAAQTAYLGGFDIIRDPTDLPSALQSGLPLCGGYGPRSLRDLVSLTESPIGWPLPLGYAIPGVPTTTTRHLPVPGALREGLLVGTGSDGAEVRVAENYVGRHVAMIGKTGCGKSALISARALDDVRSGIPFMLFDPHGFVADRIVVVAEREGHSLRLLDAFDSSSEGFSPVPALEPGGASLDEVTTAAGHLADALMASLPDAKWAGPRWRQQAIAIGYIAAFQRVDLATAIYRYADRSARGEVLADPLLPDFARRILSLLQATSAGDAAELIGWVTSKFDGLVSGPSRRLLAAPDAGVHMRDLLDQGESLVVNLAGLPRIDAGLIGHLILAAALDAAMANPSPRRRYDIFVDEASLFPVAGLEGVIHTGRKFGANLWLAIQSTEQCSAGLVDAIGATGVHFAFRQTPSSAHRLAGQFGVQPVDLMDLPDFHAYLKVGSMTTTVDVPRYEEVPARDKR